jgi:phosphatidylserine decarboxylase
VAAILVAGVRLSFLDLVIDPRRSAPLVIPLQNTFRKGQEMGWFEHGSTIIVLAPKGVTLSDTVELGSTIRVGEALMRQSRI